jgi:hypothetical protein
MTRFAPTFAGVLILVAISTGGCGWFNRSLAKDTERIEQLQADLEQVADSRDGLQTVVVDQQKQIRSLQALGKTRLDKLFHVEKIELGRYTAGIDTDGKSGDDAVKVYLRPIDREGHTIKAAGDVKIRLFDLGADPRQSLIGEYEWSADQVAKQWSSSFMTYHFSFVCPWKKVPPLHKEVTVRVEFVDYLTGKHFTAQKLCKVKLPAE